MAQVSCPNCGGTSIDAWYREPVRYNGHFELDDTGEPDFQFDVAGEIGGDGGDLEEYVCDGCLTILEVADKQLVARGHY